MWSRIRDGLVSFRRSLSRAARRSVRWVREAWPPLRERARGVLRSERAARVRARAGSFGSVALAASRVGWRAARRVLAAAAVGVLLAALIGAAFWSTTRVVPPGAIGVKQAQWGGGGIVERDFPCGLHLSLRGWHGWHLLDGRTHYLAFAYDTEGGNQDILAVRTKDGDKAQVAVSVPYRIKPGEGHLLVRGGFKGVYRQQARAITEKVLLQELANLSREDFQDTEVRLARCDETLEKLNRLLAERHLVADSVRISLVLFNMNYEKHLQENQLSHQLALLAEAAAEVESETDSQLLQQEMEAEAKTQRATLDLELERLTADARKRIARIQNEAERYDKEQRAAADTAYERLLAEGNLELLKAEARREELLNQSYESAGGRIHLARLAAENLRIRQVTLNSNDPSVPKVLDLDEMVKLLLGEE